MANISKDGTAYELHGLEGAPVIALIHGLGLCRHLWDAYLRELTPNFQILNYDLYGHGESAPPKQKASLKVYSDQLANLMDELNIPKAHVVGFSIGGMINRRFAMDHSKKLESLVILNSPHDRGEEAQAQVEERALKVREQGASSTLEDALKRWFTPQYQEAGQGVQLVRGWREKVDPESYAQAAWVLANGVRELIKPETPIKANTLVMTCENDTGSTPKMSHDIAAEIENSQTHIIPHLQHLGLIEYPELFINPIKDFIQRIKT